MNRDIKFKRVFKNRSSGEISFMEWGNIDFRGQSVFDFSSFASPGTNSFSRPIADCQYTGLKDKNGKEIYEGDLMRLDDNWFLGEVGFQHGQFVFTNLGASTTLACKIKDGYVVVGNIYENPELVNQKQETY